MRDTTRVQLRHADRHPCCETDKVSISEWPVARLENAGLIDADLELTADVRYSLALTSDDSPSLVG